MKEEQNLSKAENVCQDFNRYVDELRGQGKCYFLPFRIKKIRLRNIRVFQEFETQFEGFNLVVGDCGTGKTTLVNSIAFVTGLLLLSEDTMLRAGSKKGRIDLVCGTCGLGGTWHVTISKNSIQGTEIPGCVVLDDAGICLPTDRYQDFLVFLSNLHRQVILTVPESHIDKKQYELLRNSLPTCNILSTGKKYRSFKSWDNENSCRHKWIYTNYMPYKESKLPLLRKCTKCRQTDELEYDGGDMWHWEHVKARLIRGTFTNILPVIPYGSSRKIQITLDNGKDIFLPVYFQALDQETKGIHLGDKLEISYIDRENFIIHKIRGKKRKKSSAFRGNKMRKSDAL